MPTSPVRARARCMLRPAPAGRCRPRTHQIEAAGPGRLLTPPPQVPWPGATSSRAARAAGRQLLQTPEIRPLTPPLLSPWRSAVPFSSLSPTNRPPRQKFARHLFKGLQIRAGGGTHAHWFAPQLCDHCPRGPALLVRRNRPTSTRSRPGPRLERGGAPCAVATPLPWPSSEGIGFRKTLAGSCCLVSPAFWPWRSCSPRHSARSSTNLGPLCHSCASASRVNGAERPHTLLMWSPFLPGHPKPKDRRATPRATVRQLQPHPLQHGDGLCSACMLPGGAAARACAPRVPQHCWRVVSHGFTLTARRGNRPHLSQRPLAGRAGQGGHPCICPPLRELPAPAALATMCAPQMLRRRPPPCHGARARARALRLLPLSTPRRL
jgi:hypothetical protein